MDNNEEEPISENESEHENDDEMDQEEEVIQEEGEENDDDEDEGEEDIDIGEGAEEEYFPGNAEAYGEEEDDLYLSDDNMEEDEDDDEKDIEIRIEDEFKTEYINTIHPEEVNDSIQIMNEKCLIKRDDNNFINDANHITYPILTKYEKARILGLRISQLNKGAKPLIEYNQFIIDNNIIAEKELQDKRLPFIIMRPIPNGGKEYWRLQDLEILDR